MGKLVLNGVEYIGGGSGGGSSVMPNSPIAPGEIAPALQTLRVDGDAYRIMPGATVVEISQADYNHLSESQKKDGSIYMVQDSTASVNKIYYMNTEYANTEGGNSDSYQMDTLFSADSYQANITLSHPYTDYDLLVIDGIAPVNNRNYKSSVTYVASSIKVNEVIGSYTDGSVAWYNVDDTTHLSNVGRLDVYITNIYGIKF